MTGGLNSPESTRWNHLQRRIGITGGISTGKSSVGNFLKQEKDLPIIDADIYAKKVLAPGSNASKTVLDRFGRSLIGYRNKDGLLAIERSKLSKIIFENIKERLWLEELVHPLIKTEINNQLIKYQTKSIVILIIPLLFEADFMEFCNEVWVISCTPEQQLERLIKRDNLSQIDAESRIQSQWPLDKKQELANVTIDNSKEPKHWAKQIENLLK